MGFFLGFLCYVFLDIALIILAIALILLISKDRITGEKMKLFFKLLVILQLVFIILSTHEMIKLSPDIAAIRNSKFSTINGTITDVKIVEGYRGYSSMLFCINGISFDVDQLSISKQVIKGEKVEIKYLPISKYIIEIRVER